MSKLSYTKALNRALHDALATDPAVCIFGEDVGAGMAGPTLGLQAKFGPDRIIDMPLSEQAFTSMAIGAALNGRRPIIEFQIPSLLFLTFEQITNQAHKLSLMTGGQTHVPITYLIPGSGSRQGWAGQHSDHPYSLFAHTGIKTLLPSTPTDAYGLLTTAIHDNDPTILFAPAQTMHLREDITQNLTPIPLGQAHIRREGTDVTVFAAGHLVHTALAVADEVAGEISVEVLDPRTLYPLDWATLERSLAKTGRLVTVDDSNRMCGLGAEVLATAAEQMHLVAPPRRVTRPDGAVLPFALGLDHALQPGTDQLRRAIRAVMR